jgi:hypothetical protein
VWDSLAIDERYHIITLWTDQKARGLLTLIQKVGREKRDHPLFSEGKMAVKVRTYLAEFKQEAEKSNILETMW